LREEQGSILQRAVQFITQLKENETQNIEKWTLEKLLTEQAIAELSASNDKLKAECERAWREVETWKKTCQSAVWHRRRMIHLRETIRKVTPLSIGGRPFTMQDPGGLR